MTAETTRIWMYENRERWNEYQRNYYKRKKEKVHEYQSNGRMRCAAQASEESTNTAGMARATMKTDA